MDLSPATSAFEAPRDAAHAPPPAPPASRRRALALLWDMDGTLADSEPLHQRTLAAVLASVGIAHLPDDLFEATIGLSEYDVHAYCTSRFALTIEAAAWTQFRNAAYAREAAGLQPRPGALEVFRAMAAGGVPQAVVSNASRPVLDTNLHALKLHAATAVSVSRSDVRNGKPSPEPYLKAARLLGVAAGDALVVEDSLVGASAGLAAGMRVAAWMAPGMPSVPFPAACRCVSSAAELRAFLSLNVQGAP